MKKVIDLFFQALRNILFLCYFEKTTILEGVASYKLKRKTKIPFIYIFCFLSNRELKNIALSKELIYFLADNMDEQFKKEEHEALVFTDDNDSCIVKLCWKEDVWNVDVSSLKLSSDWQPEKGFLTSVVK